jgi:RNA polymerase sigma factor (sigma-70 family)
MEEDIGDIRHEPFLSNLSAKQEEAIALLYEDTKMDQFLGKRVYNFRQGQDKNDVRQDLALMIISAGPALLDDVKSLRAWLSTAAVNLCRNDYRHKKVVKQHREKSASESVMGKMRDGAVVLQRPLVKTPEQRMQEREQEEQLEEQLEAKLQGFIESLPRDMQVVARMWDEGKSPAEIAEAIGKSEKTVYRHHRKFQEALVERCMAGDTASEEMRLREVVDDLSWLALVA